MSGVHDWEEHFADKSQRRAEKVRGRRKRKWLRRAVMAWLILIVVAAGWLLMRQ